MENDGSGKAVILSEKEVSVTRTELFFRDACERLLDVLTATGPGELLAHGAHCRAAHNGTPLVVREKHTPGGMQRSSRLGAP